MYMNTQIPATVGRFVAGDFGELQQHPGLFFPMTRFTYGLSYSVFSAEGMGYTPDETRVSGRYATFVDGFAMFFGSRLLAEAQEFWDVEPLDPTLLQPLESDIPTLILNGELDHVLPPRYPTEMARQLSNSYLYLFPGVAHSPIDAGDCALGMTLQFVSDPSQAPDSTCVEGFTHELVVDQPAD
jgi:pimeloyl-ACP methyl ester carboxylesterase